MNRQDELKTFEALKYDIVTDEYGTVRYFLNGERHRIDGPAIIKADGTKFWYLNGEIHRDDGPAVIHANGTVWYYLNNKQLSEEEFDQL